MPVKLHFKFLCKANISLGEGAWNALNSLPHSCIQPISFAKHIGALQRDTQNGCITERLSVSNCWSRRAIKKAWLSKAKKEKKWLERVMECIDQEGHQLPSTGQTISTMPSASPLFNNTLLWPCGEGVGEEATVGRRKAIRPERCARTQLVRERDTLILACEWTD